MPGEPAPGASTVGPATAPTFQTELETVVRGVGSELATVLADRLRWDAVDSRFLGRPP